MLTPTFSIVHATARYNGWQNAHKHLLRNKSRTAGTFMEYILVVDDPNFVPEYDDGHVNVVYTDTTKGLDGCVRAYNDGAKKAKGKIIILHSDDMYVPPLWDSILLNTVGDRIDEDFVVQCKSENPNLITFQILSKTRYDRLGYALYPGYHSLWADNEFTQHAKLDGCIIPCDMSVEHRHPIYRKADWDDVYEKENNFTWAQHGRDLFYKRQALGFE